MKCPLLFSVFTILFSGLGEVSFSQCSTCSLSNNGTSTSYNLSSCQTLCITGGTYTGNIDNLPSGATICVARETVFRPGNMNNLSGTINNYNISTFSNMNQHGVMLFNNMAGGVLNVTASFTLGNSSTLTNSGVMYFSAGFSTNSGSTVPHTSVTKAASAAVDTNTLRGNCSNFVFLPMKLTSFEAVPSEAGNISIRWTVTGEKDLFYYFLEGSTDGTSYHQLAAVAATNGTGSNAYRYTYTFREPIAFMRLMMVDKNGKRKYSQVLPVRKPGLAEGLHLPGNPVHVTATLRVETSKAAYVQLSLPDLTGQHLLVLDKVPSNTVLTLPELNRYKSGMYILRAAANGFFDTRRLLLQQPFHFYPA